MIDPWTRTLRALAYGVAWILLLAGATLSGLWAQPSSTQQPPSAPPAQTPAQTGPSTPPGQPPSTAPGQPAQQPSTPPAQQPSTPPGQPPIQPPAPPPAPSITPPSPFVPQPGTPPPTLPPQKVAEVVIRGNDKIPVDQILAVVSTKVADPLNEEKLRNDVQSILNLGVFQDAVVRLENVPDGVRVVFVVVENPVVDKIEVKGNTVVATDDILKALSVQTGAVLNTVTMRNGVRAVEKLYQDKGYVLAHVQDVNVSPEGVLSVEMAEGHIEAIKIEGLHKTHDHVVRRELQFKPGDVFNVNDVNASLKRLYNLQYFSDVKAQPDTGSTPDLVVVTIVVTEQKTATVSFGVGYGTQTGLEGFIGFRESNLFGNGQAISFQYSQTVLFGSSYALTFHEPYFFGTRVVMDLQVFDTVTIPTDFSLGLDNQFQYDLNQIGGFISFSYPWTSTDSLNAGFKAVSSTFSNPLVGTNPPANFPFTPGQVNALIVGATRDTRNDTAIPTSGERIILSSELAFQTLGGTFQFQKYEVDFEHFLPLHGGDSTILGHVHLGYSGTPLPIQEQFYLGGQTTLRGYPSGRFRGDQEVLAQIEYRFPLSSLPFLHSFAGIQTILFVEGGDAQPANNAQWKLHPDVGVGIQFKTPVGPFRLDYGISGEGSQFWISSGAVF